MIGVLERRSVTAAGAVASACGLELQLEEAEVLQTASNVLVHLRPAPIVARVMTGTVALHDDPWTWLEREISVLEFLAPSGVAVSPSRLIAPGPHCHDGLWMTFVEWIADVKAGPEVRSATHFDDARELGRLLEDLHDQLRPFAGGLGGLRDLREDIERLIDQLRPANIKEAETIVSLRERLEMLRTTVFDSGLPTQALHGDVSLRNLLRTPHRRLWNDFEDTFRGPVHWDVASYVGSLRTHGANDRTVREMLEGYGRNDEQELAPFLAAQDVYDEIWRMYGRQRCRLLRLTASCAGTSHAAGRNLVSVQPALAWSPWDERGISHGIDHSTVRAFAEDVRQGGWRVPITPPSLRRQDRETRNWR